MKSSIRILQQPDWDTWVYLQSVSLAEATLLTQNVCPHTYTLQSGMGLGSKIDYNKHKIIQVAINEIESRKAHWLTRVGGYPADPYKVVVELPKFAQWVLKRNWVAAQAIQNFTVMAQNISGNEVAISQPKPIDNKDQVKKVSAPSLIKPKRARHYNMILHATLKKLIAAGNERPNAFEVLSAWRAEKPVEILEVADDLFKYHDADHETMLVDLAALQKAISRQFSKAN